MRRSRLEVHVDPSTTPTGVGIGIEIFDPVGTAVNLTVWALSPCCTSPMCYLDGTRPDIRCESCGRVYTSFVGISSSNLLHAGPWFQCVQCNTPRMKSHDYDDIRDYIERWTGLTCIEFSITL